MPPPTPKQVRDKQQQARQHVIDELISTERTYAEELSRFVERIVPRLEAGQVTPGKQAFANSLGGLVQNLEQFLHLSRATVSDLSSSSPDSIGPALARLAAVLPVYTQYATNYANAQSAIRALLLVTEEEDKSFVSVDWDAAIQGEARRTGLAGFLILPIQRIPRYTLLLTELVPHVNNNEKEELELVKQALRATEECALGMNDAIAEVQRVQSLVSLYDSLRPPVPAELETLLTHATASPTRIVLSAQLVNAANSKAYQYVLLTQPDTLVCISVASQTCKRVFKLAGCTASAATGSTPQFTLVIPARDSGGGTALVLECASLAQRDTWLAALASTAPLPTARKASVLRQLMSYTPSSSSSSPVTQQQQPDNNNNNSAEECSLCAASFSLLSRKQQCGRCARDVCSACSPHRRHLPSSTSTSMRVCDVCADDMDFVSECVAPHLLRLSVQLTLKQPSSSSTDVAAHYYWSVSQPTGSSSSKEEDDEADENGTPTMFGPSNQGRFLLPVPLIPEGGGNAVTLRLCSQHGATVLASHVVDVCALANHPRISKGFTQQIDLFGGASSSLSFTLLATFAFQPAPVLFLQLEEDGIRVAATPPATAAASSASGSFLFSATRRKSVEALLLRRPSLSSSSSTPTPPAAPRPPLPPPLPPTTAVHDVLLPSSRRKRFNLRAFKDLYESRAAEKTASLFFTRLVEVILAWAIRNAAEGSSIQAYYAQLLYKFHCQAAVIAQQPPQFSMPQLVLSEAVYVSKLELLVERYGERRTTTARPSTHHRRAASPSTLSPSSLSPPGTASSSSGSALLKVKQMLANAFGQPVSEHEALQFPAVSACLSAVEQMIPIHRSFLGQAKGPMGPGFDALHRLASLARVYSTYGAHLAECFQLLIMHGGSSDRPSRQVAALLPPSGAAEEDDPELALRWVLMSNGILRASSSSSSTSARDNATTPPQRQPQQQPWTLLDLLLAPLQRINFYCEFARETAAPSLPALLNTRRFLVKSLLKRANVQLLRAIDARVTGRNGGSSLVDNRRWFLRASVLVWNAIEVVAVLFSDRLLVCRPGNSSWDVLHEIDFTTTTTSRQRRRNALTVNPALAAATTAALSAVADVRFAFQLDSVLLFVPQQLLQQHHQQDHASSSSSPLFSLATAGYCATSSNGSVVGPGGFRSVSSSSSSTRSSMTRMSASSNVSTVASPDIGSSRFSLGGSPGGEENKHFRLKRQLKLDWVSDLRRVLRLWEKEHNPAAAAAATADDDDDDEDVCWRDDIAAWSALYGQQNNHHSGAARSSDFDVA